MLTRLSLMLIAVLPLTAAQAGDADRQRLLQERECWDCQSSGVDLSGANFDHVQIVTSMMDGADFRNASLRIANITQPSIRNARFDGADLSDAAILYPYAQWAVFDGVTLRGANLSWGEFAGASFVGADLTGGNFFEALDVDLTGAKLCNTTMPDGSKDNSGC